MSDARTNLSSLKHWVFLMAITSNASWNAEETPATDSVGREERVVSDALTPQAQFEMGSRYLLGIGELKQPALGLELIQKAAARNNPPAQVMLGEIYLQGGFGLPKDSALAFSMFRAASDSGYAEGQFMLGRLLEQGVGAPKDDDAAVRSFQRAAAQGHLVARGKIAERTLVGRGMPKNVIGAFNEFQEIALTAQREKAELPLAMAANALGMIFSAGEGIEADGPKSYMWFSIAILHGSKVAAGNLERLKSVLTQAQLGAGDALLDECRDEFGARCF